ncbi:EAL domain-containing response regulator [Alkalinema sp. FACHB-956]|uniref:two-component system response regulator n=1 Tax=Alkalinema sp. FACHB-956 TaxID=2692768 RepID=UPI001685847C|nr:EAL domain-containing response regulator [Alkalinema sp. FACHB-956]MBD2326099.1 EAL domain-containing response regulator [Alkalinema sp. FACHB-956]
MKTILVVEIQQTRCDRIVQILDRAGFQVHVATEAFSGLACAQAYQPNLILCTHDLPHLDGLSFLQSLRAIPSIAHLACILLCSHVVPGLQRRAMAGGADDVLLYDTRMEQDLLDAIHSRLRRQMAIVQSSSHSTQWMSGKPESSPSFPSVTASAPAIPSDGVMGSSIGAPTLARLGRGEAGRPSEASWDAVAMPSMSRMPMSSLHSQLRRAIDQQELELYYQPQMDCHTAQVKGLEALVRWHHPILGTLSPDVFIPLAEATGLIVPLGDWVLRQACQQVQACQRSSASPIKLSVNVSTHQLGLGVPWVQRLIGVLRETQFDPRNLTLELTETTLMQEIARVKSCLQLVQELGIQIALDDFGTGYSSLNYLNWLPINVLKIDRTFIQKVTFNQTSAAIAETILRLAQQLRLETVAEGVETIEQLFFLRRYQCQIVQGYFYSPALPFSETQAFLSQHQLARKAIV